ncbi:MAG: septal ring lytic transglycosylase RlpA family protein [Bacteroidota bacterium]|nr:septal ring lytic transglycosylase RlpA family protein [Bacteroidota bacterium]
MSSLTKVLVVVVLLMLVGFTIVTNETKPTDNLLVSEEVKITENAKVANSSIISYKEIGEWTVTWYGPRFHGKKTANGEVYDQMALTAAHRSFSFGTLLRITNPKNNKAVIIRINDRGPVSKKFGLDLSKGAAEELDIVKTGVAKVKVEQVYLKGVNFPVISIN